ncbi:MAG TPA: biotin/lipoyl-containing protein [Actinomycetota bacterium]|nr:biotin/lipoyl-containing protein [Actinomycetota bacterium]
MSVFTKGVIATIAVPGVLFLLVYMLLSMILGAKLAYLVEACVTFGCLVIMGFIWTISALGPTGNATAWQGIGVGPGITKASFDGTTYDLSSYPNSPPWVKPTQGKYLADLKSADDELAEESEVKTVMDGLVGNAISPIPGVLAQVKPLIQGTIGLETGKFTETDIRMQPATVKGKASIIAVAKGVASAPVSEQSLPNNLQTATVVKYLVKVGDTVSNGQDVLEATANGQSFNLPSTDSGVVAAFGPAAGSLVRAGVPILILDVSSHPGSPPPVTIVAVRVRGDLHTPAAIVFVVSMILFLLHLLGLNRYEKARKQSALAGQPT